MDGCLGTDERDQRANFLLVIDPLPLRLRSLASTELPVTAAAVSDLAQSLGGRAATLGRLAYLLAEHDWDLSFATNCMLEARRYCRQIDVERILAAHPDLALAASIYLEGSLAEATFPGPERTFLGGGREPSGRRIRDRLSAFLPLWASPSWPGAPSRRLRTYTCRATTSRVDDEAASGVDGEQRASPQRWTVGEWAGGRGRAARRERGDQGRARESRDAESHRWGEAPRDRREDRARPAAASPAPSRASWLAWRLAPTLRRDIGAVALVVIAMLTAWGLLGERAGLLGLWTELLRRGFGWAALLVPVALIALVVELFRTPTTEGSPLFSARGRHIIGSVVLFLAILGLLHLPAPDFASPPPAAGATWWEAGQGGGFLGYLIAIPLVTALRPIGAGIVLLGLAIVAAVIVFNTDLRSLGGVAGRTGRTLAASVSPRDFRASAQPLPPRDDDADDDDATPERIELPRPRLLKEPPAASVPGRRAG